MPSFSPQVQFWLGLTCVVYVVVMYAVSWVAQRQVHSTEDFLVAGRRLPLSLSWMTLLATWFGAGTMLAATDAVRRDGLQMAALDPWGAGVCLLLAGAFVAKPLWSLGLLTISDFFRMKFGRAAEILSAVILVPSYFGWIAAQFVALSGMLEMCFGMDPQWGLLVVAVVGTFYTLLGGMWSVALTDGIQIILVLLGLVVLGFSAFSQWGNGSAVAGMQRVFEEASPGHLQPIPLDDLRAFAGWLGVFAVGALGNLPGQDLMQRIFAAKSANVARHACYIAGVVYLLFGMIPVALGLLAHVEFPADVERAILPALAQSFLSPGLAIVFLVALLSAVLSTIDSAILSPASVMAQNLLKPLVQTDKSSLALNRFCVGFVAIASLITAYQGENAYTLLESAYELVLVGLFVPLMIGLYGKSSSQPAILCLHGRGQRVVAFAFGPGMGGTVRAEIRLVLFPASPVARSDRLWCVGLFDVSYIGGFPQTPIKEFPLRRPGSLRNLGIFQIMRCVFNLQCAHTVAVIRWGEFESLCFDSHPRPLVLIQGDGDGTRNSLSRLRIVGVKSA